MQLARAHGLGTRMAPELGLFDQTARAAAPCTWLRIKEGRKGRAPADLLTSPLTAGWGPGSM